MNRSRDAVTGGDAVTVRDGERPRASEGHRHDRRQTSPKNRRSAAEPVLGKSLQAKGMERLRSQWGSTPRNGCATSRATTTSYARVIELGVKIAGASSRPWARAGARGADEREAERPRHRRGSAALFLRAAEGHFVHPRLRQRYRTAGSATAPPLQACGYV